MATFLASWQEPGKPAVETAWNSYKNGVDLLGCLVDGLSVCEESAEFLLVGRGALPNSDGEVELDAALMDGADLSAGAVCAVQGIAPVIKLARHVKDDTDHVMIAGAQARRFAIECGFEVRSMMTEENCRAYEKWRSNPENSLQFDHSIDHHGDTVTMLGFEEPGHVVAASSTSGLAWKKPGRVGDSPIVGAGIYADDEIGCAGATGVGEELWKAVASFRTVEAMKRGLSAQEACEETILHMIRRHASAVQKACVVFAMGNDGNFGAAITEGEFQLWICRDGEIEMRTFSGLR